MTDLGALIPKLKACFRKHPEIQAVYAFGSMVKGTNRRSRELDLSSDLDLGVLLNSSVPLRNRWHWWERLYGELGSRVKQEVDVIILNGAPLGLAHEILRTGERVYEKPGRKHRWEEANLLIEALDFLPTKVWIEEELVEHVRAGHG